MQVIQELVSLCYAVLTSCHMDFVDMLLTCVGGIGSHACGHSAGIREGDLVVIGFSAIYDRR